MSSKKVKTFFGVCQRQKLGSNHGVMIPAINKVWLMLRVGVREAVTAQLFAVYTARQVEDVMQTLTGLPRGKQEKHGACTEAGYNRAVDLPGEELCLAKSCSS